MGLLSRLAGGLRRGGGRAPAPSVQMMEDLPAFRIAPPYQYSSDELRAAGQRPTAMYGSGQHWMDGGRENPLAQMQEMQAMRTRMTQLKRERALAKTQEEADDIDMEMAVIRRDLGIDSWD